jgi:predicted Zn-dependent protease
VREWLEARRALREFRDTPAARGHGRDFRGYFRDQIKLAQDAHFRGNDAQALEIWRHMRRRFPDLCLRSKIGLPLLVSLGCHDEVEALIEEGRRLAPDHKELYATVAASNSRGLGDFDEALRRCMLLQTRFPNVASGYTIAASCLTDQGRDVEAEVILTKGLNKLPGASEILVMLAHGAMRRKDWVEALSRWEAVRDRAEGENRDDIQWRYGMAHALCELERYEEAEAVATEAVNRHPTNPWAYVELATIATNRGDLNEAAQRWDTCRRRCPYFGLAYLRGFELARDRGLSAEADQILELGVRQMRYDLNLHVRYARHAEERGDQMAAEERWALVRERFPNHREERTPVRERAVASG